MYSFTTGKYILVNRGITYVVLILEINKPLKLATMPL